MYVDKQNQLYFGDCAQGDREASPEEIAVWEASRLPTPLDLLNKLDAENALTQRNLRDTIMLMVEAIKVVSNDAVDLSVIPGVAKVIEVEAQAAALRAQL